MAGLFTPTTRSAGAIPNLKHSPASSPAFPSQRGSAKTVPKRQFSAPTTGASTAFPDSNLSLKRVIGCSTNAFDSHPPSRSFAYTAGAAAVVVTLDEELEVTQRFFRARPNAPTLTSAAAGSSYNPSIPQGEGRVRAAASLREAGIGYSPSPSSSAFGDDSSSSKTWTARERIKAATCLSLSPDGKWLAVGETGYSPRVLVFSVSKDVPSDLPVAAMAEHTFGVCDVAFSPDSKYLASIGTANDGFIYIWSLNPNKQGLVQLYASNKCTSFIRQIAWMGKSLVTVGTRHVRIWRTEDVCDGRKTRRKWRLTRKQQKTVGPGPIVLHGRNALLGNMSDSTMSCVVGISEDKALICSERGDICLLEESGMRFSKVADAGFGVNCIAVDSERTFAWVAGKSGSHSALVLANIVPPTPPVSPSSSRSSSPVLPSGCLRANVLAMASMFGHLFTLDSNRSLKVINMATVEGIPVPQSVVRELPAHKDACLGVRPLPQGHASGAAFFTWSAGGGVLFWSLDGVCSDDFQIELEQPAYSEDDVPNELKAVRVSQDGKFFATGDKYGVLRVIDAETRGCEYDVKAHGGEIMDIAIHNNDTIISCARDRTLQVFRKSQESWTLSQTLDEHTASVSRVLLLEDGAKLISCSTDRTIIIRELCHREALDGTVTDAYVPLRTLNTKASPIHMAAISDSASTLLVSTLDRHIVKYDLLTGKALSSFRVTDESGDAVVMDAITLSESNGHPSKPRILVGISTTDKSIRLYDLNGGLVDKEWGHTEGVSDVCLLELGGKDPSEATNIISTGTDGTIMIWGFATPKTSPKVPTHLSPGPMPGQIDASVSPKDVTASRTPLRRVLSKSELLDFTPRSSPTSDPAGSGSKSVGSTSPPRPLRKKTSLYSMNRPLTAVSKVGLGIQQQTQTSQQLIGPASEDSLSPSTSAPASTSSAATREARKAPRERTPSPPDLQTRLPRRSSYDARTRRKSDTNTNGLSNVNGLAESLSRSLRTFRKKIETSGPDGCGVKPEVMRELQRELSLTVKGLSDGKGSAKATTGCNKDEDMMTAMLESYSAKLLSMVSNKLGQQLQQQDEMLTQNGIDLPNNISDDSNTGLDRRKGKYVETTGEG